MFNSSVVRRITALVFMFSGILFSAPLSKRLLDRLSADPRPVHAWVYADRSQSADLLSARLKMSGVRVRRVSHWLNAVSVEGDKAALTRITNLAGVARIEMVERFRKTFSKSLAKPFTPAAADTFYGAAFDALNLMRIPQIVDSLPEIGRTAAGKGVTIALLDAGFNLSHEVFAHFDSTTVIAARDYVAGLIDSSVDFDTIVRNESGDSPDQENHGTSVLSVIAAYKPGKLVGVAPFCHFILAKTEQTQVKPDSVWIESETVAEEDNWIAAVEWAVDTMKADIISSSLGYRYDFTDGRASYSISELNGDSLPITRAANIAAQKGTVVIVAVGNEGDLGASSLAAPADGINVITVGAVDANGNLADYSSYGPTGDGRVKPDIVAPGDFCTVAQGTTTGYSYTATGTSFAAPMAAGVCALLLQYLKAHNDSLSVMEIADRFRAFSFFPAGIDSGTAGFGFGIVDAYSLIAQEKRRIAVEAVPTGEMKFRIFPVPVKGASVRFETITDNLGPINGRNRRFKVTVYSISGEVIFAGDREEEKVGPSTAVDWNLLNGRGGRTAPGIYLVRAAFGNERWMKKFAVVR